MQSPVPGKFYIDTEGIHRQVMIDSLVNPVVIPDEPTLLQTLRSWGVSPISKVLQALRVPTSDASGNITAQVNHRTGTLVSLLGLAGGNGEVAIATSPDCIVVYNGVAGQAKVYGKDGSIITDYATVLPTEVPTGTGVWTPLIPEFDTYGSEGTSGLPIMSGGVYTGEFNNLLVGSSNVVIVVNGEFAFAANATGTVRKVRLEGFFGFWRAVSPPVQVVNVGNFTLRYSGLLYGSGGASISKFRLTCQHDAGVGLNVSAAMLEVSLRRGY